VPVLQNKHARRRLTSVGHVTCMTDDGVTLLLLHNIYSDSLPCEHFPKMRKFAQSHACLFGTTYKCEQSFSSMKIIKSKLRSRWSDSSLKSCLLLSVTNLTS